MFLNIGGNKTLLRALSLSFSLSISTYLSCSACVVLVLGFYNRLHNFSTKLKQLFLVKFSYLAIGKTKYCNYNRTGEEG